MQFIFTGFTQDMGFRVFAFEGVAEDRTRTNFTVRLDLALVRRYGIRVQELPLLCRELLDHRAAGEDRSVTFTEDCMRSHADNRAERDAAQKRKSTRKPPSPAPGRPEDSSVPRPGVFPAV